MLIRYIVQKIFLNKIYIKEFFLIIIGLIFCLEMSGQKSANDTILPVPYKLDTLNVKALSLKRLPFSSKFLKYITVKRISTGPKYKTPEESAQSFLEFEGKIIRNIDIKLLKPFGPKLCDTCEVTNKWYEKMANALHYPTRKKYLKRLLTISQGEKIDPLEIADNERLIRALSHINDAIIFIKPVEGNNEYVDLLLVCEDVFSWAFELKTDLYSEFEVESYHKNLFGKGHQVLSSLSFEDDKEPRWGYSFGYGVNNISRSYIDMSLIYKNNFEGERLTFSMNRDFVTTETKWAGGLIAEQARNAHKIKREDKFELKDSIDFINIDSWLGYAHRLKSEKLVRKHLVYSLGYYGTFFSRRPELKLDSSLFFLDRSYVLASLAISKRRYYKTNFVHDLGKTEDIPKGLYFAFLLGYESNNLGKYLYSGIEFKRTWFTNKSFEYFATKLSVGSYYSIGKKSNRQRNTDFERGIIDLGIYSITKLYKLKRSRIRFYADMEYTIGFLRYPDDYIDLNEEVRGFKSDMIRGNQKFSVKLTQNTFLPYVINGFRFSFFTFADVGVIGRNDDLIFNKEKYWGLGLGFKFSNDNLIFRTISLRFAFYPKVPNDFNTFKVLMRSEKEKRFIDLEPTKPQIIDYR